MKEIDRLSEVYVAARQENAGSEKLAILEEQIWQRCRAEVGPGKLNRRDWLMAKFGGPVSEYSERGSIHMAGKWAHVLFDKIDSGFIGRNSAFRLCVQVKKIHEATKRPHDEIIQELLSNWKGSLRGIGIDIKKSDRPIGAVGSRQFGIEMMSLVERFLESECGPSVRESSRAALAEGFRTSLEQLIDEFRHSISTTKERSRSEAITRIGYSNFSWACEVLGLSLKFGQRIGDHEIDKFKKLAARNRLRRSRDLHPDRNTAPAATEEFQAVQEAFRVINQYLEMMRSKNAVKSI